MIPTNQAIYAYLVASLLGLLIGLERERKREQKGSLFAGVTTFPLVALFGAIGASLPNSMGWVIMISTASLGALVGLAYWRESAGIKLSGTSHVAVLVTYMLGLTVGLKAYAPALAGAVIVTAILSLRDELRLLVSGLGKADLLALVQFSVLSLVVLPLIPNESMGPWEVWNPRTIWLLVVFISGISFVGYVSSKTLGAQKGIWLSSLIGGIASSTAVTLSLSQRSRENPNLAHLLTAGVLTASAISASRLLVLLSVLEPRLALESASFLLSFILASALLAFFLFRRKQSDTLAELRLGNPFALKTALLFAFTFSIILLLSELAQRYMGNTGIYALSGLAGLTQLDAITLSLVEQVKRGLDLNLASLGLAIAMTSNTLLKLSLSFTLGSKPFAHLLSVYLTLAIAFAFVLMYFVKFRLLW